MKELSVGQKNGLDNLLKDINSAWIRLAFETSIENLKNQGYSTLQYEAKYLEKIKGNKNET